jgi:hypothetical protein
MKKAVGTLILAAWIGCGPQKERVVELVPADSSGYELLHDSDYGIYYFEIPVNEHIRQTFQFHIPDRKARIFRLGTSSGAPIQEFHLSEDMDYDGGYYAENPEAAFSFQDFNADGFIDISIIRTTGVANVWADVYIHDPATHRWVFHELLSLHPNLTVDPDKQTITYYNRGGFGGAWYESGTFDLATGKIALQRTEIQTSDGDNTEAFVRTIMVRNTAGEMTIASKVRIRERKEGGEQQCLLEGSWEEFDKTQSLLFADTDQQVVRVDGRSSGC